MSTEEVTKKKVAKKVTEKVAKKAVKKVVDKKVDKKVEEKVVDKVKVSKTDEVKATETNTNTNKKENTVEKSNTEVRRSKKKNYEVLGSADNSWGILHIYSSYNNTHLHVTDITGSETIVKVTGGMVTKSDRLKATPNIAMAAAKQISSACHNAKISALYVKLRAVGGHNGPMRPGPGSQAAIRMLTRYGIKLGRIEDVTPVPHDSCRKKGGRRGRRV